MSNGQDDLLRRILDEVLEGRQALGADMDGVRNRLDSFRDETLSNFDGVFLRLENIESEVQAVSAAIARLEGDADRERPLREKLHQEIGRLRDRLATLEKRLSELDGDSVEPH